MDNPQDELEEQSPFLAKMRQKKSQPFSTPPQYFERVQDEVWKKIQAEHAPAPAKIAWWQRLVQSFLRPSYGIGLAGICLLVGVSVFLLQKENLSPNESSASLLSQISDEEIYGYVSENEEDFDTEILLENLQESDLANIPTPSEVFSDTLVPKTTIQDTSSIQKIKPAATSTEELLQGISAEDILQFLEEEGIMDDILDEQKID